MTNKLVYLQEEDFREAIVVPWLRKKGFKILRQHGHGPDEQEKDLLIEDSNGKVGSCVVKPKIHGQYSKEGNIEEIRCQVAASFNVPFPDYINKKRTKVDFVIVVSENKIFPTAKESIVESFKNKKNILFYSGDDIIEEYYALPIKLKKINLAIFVRPKNNEEIENLKKEFLDFETDVEYSGDSNNFGVFNRTINCGKIRWFIIKKSFEDFSKIKKIEILGIYNYVEGKSSIAPLVYLYIYFDEDKIEKIENFFNNYIGNKFGQSTLDQPTKKIAVSFDMNNIDKFDNLIGLLEKWS